MEDDSISQLRKKPHTKNAVPLDPVLLTLQYDSEQIKLLIQLAVDAEIRICTRVDIVTPNGLNVSEDFSLSPGQITQVWQNRPNVIEIYLEPPQNLAQHLPEAIVANVGIHGLFIDRISADFYLSLTQEKPNPETVNQIDNNTIG